MVESHSEKDIYDKCVRLMSDLTDKFYNYLDYLGIDVTKLDEEEQFSALYYPEEIVSELFLSRTTHSGGTSTREKCKELGINTNLPVKFDFSEYLEASE